MVVLRKGDGTAQREQLAALVALVAAVQRGSCKRRLAALQVQRNHRGERVGRVVQPGQQPGGLLAAPLAQAQLGEHRQREHAAAGSAQGVASRRPVGAREVLPAGLGLGLAHAA